LVVVAIAARYKGYRYPIEVIGHAVWLYHRFALSLRDVEELMLARGVAVTYETIRSWCVKFGPDYAARLRRRRPRPGDTWHVDEVFVKINGTTHYLWRAVDQHGNVFDILVQSRRNTVAAKRFLRTLLKGLRSVPRVIVTDTLASYQVAHRGGFAVDDPSPLQVPQQPGRELPSADQGPGTGDETLRLASAGPTVPVCVRQHPTTLSVASSSDQRARMANRDDQPLRGLEPDHYRRSGLKDTVSHYRSSPNPLTSTARQAFPNNLTMPFRQSLNHTQKVTVQRGCPINGGSDPGIG
jgi:transposase-like protein